MLANTFSASLLGVEGLPVRVEVDVAYGLPSLTIVGLAGSQVQEARERVRSALRNSGFELPARRITVNLSPADLPKDGTGYDLAIAVGILAASGQLPDQSRLEGVALLGELALDGGLRPIVGAMSLVAAARDDGRRAVIVAEADAPEAACVTVVAALPASRLGEAVGYLAGVRQLIPATAEPSASVLPALDGAPDLADVMGQPAPRRSLEIAVAGRHNLALCGPPGVGKTLILRCAQSLQPPLDDIEALEVARIHSAAGLLDRRAPLNRRRPFRAPHHTVSTQGLVGGGPRVRPGEASLAHRGILMLDEALQFRADALDGLRQPLEAGMVTIARAEGAVSLPARFALLIAFNPCACGWRGSTTRECHCDDAAARRYAARLSGPLRDRIDLWVRAEESPGAAVDGVEPSAAVAERVQAAWARQLERQSVANADLPLTGLAERVRLGGHVASAVEQRGQRFLLSPRRLHRLMRVARTIADLDASETVEARHVDEALYYRPEVAA
ncbi:MAG TPA: YifB family Mg chelatase-like AAA ATPase [Candidatus Limnocylindria bacterium]|nr:YifB family Mg chelatase-like AAA ATPase [Candidatus Limnocylindria bacterium]